MTGPEALRAIKDGKKIRRKAWPEDCAISLNGGIKRFISLLSPYGNTAFMEYTAKPEGYLSIMEELLMMDDWEIME